MSPCVALVVFGVVCLLLATMVIVGRMRGRHGIQAPAVSGHPMFERAYRVKMHTLLDLRGNIPSFIHISDGTSCCAWYRLPIAAKNPRLISSVRWYAFLCCWKILDVLKNVCPQPPAQLVDVLKKGVI